MKLFTLLASVILLSTQLFSQTFTNENMPIIGDEINGLANNDLTTFNPGESGEGVTWDFTSDTYSEHVDYSFVEVAGTPYAEDFPDAVMCGISDQDTYQYYKSLSGELSILGIGSDLGAPAPNDKILAFFDPAMNQFNLPLAYGTKHSSNYSGKYVFASNEFPLSGTITSEVDGSGTIITPAGTFSNVLRIHINITETGLTGQQVDQYLYVSQDYRFWIALHEQVSVTGDVNIQKWYAVNPPKVTQASVAIDADMTSLKVFPNPTEDMLTINSVNRIETVQLFDAMGKVVASASLDGAMTHQMDVSKLSAGIYNVVTSSNGELTTTKFIKK